MFKSLTNINSAFKFARIVAIVSVVASLVFCGVILFRSYLMVENERKKIYVLDNGKSLILALQQDLTTNRPVELRHHTQMFHELFFTLSPDVELINDNIQKAMELGDKSIYETYTDLKEAGYYRRVIANNIVQKVVFDSIDCNMDVYPFAVTTFAQLVINRESNITRRNLITTFTVINASRSDNNPHGFLIQNFQVKQNNDLYKQQKYGK